MRIQKKRSISDVRRPIINNRIDAPKRYKGSSTKKEMVGSGIFDEVREILSSTSGPDSYRPLRVGTAIKNIIPASDETARPGFVGEKHMVLKLSNGKPGIANWAGPGTKVLKRLKRGDPPRTAVDKVAQRHDIDYALAQTARTAKEQQKLIRQADKRMVSNLEKLSRNKSDSQLNIGVVKNAMKGKMLAEDIRLMKKGSFGGPLTTRGMDDDILLVSKQQELEQQGFGHPGGQLKKILLRATRKSLYESKKTRPLHGGKGLKLTGSHRNPTPKEMMVIKKTCNECAMKGEGLKKIFKKTKKVLGHPVVKAIGSVILKEVIIPYAKEAIKNYMAGNGLKLAGQGLKLADLHMPLQVGQRGQGLVLAGGRYSGGKLASNIITDMKKVGLKLGKKISVDKVAPGVMKALKKKDLKIPTLVGDLVKIMLPAFTGTRQIGSGMKNPFGMLTWEILKEAMKKTNPKEFKGSGLKIKKIAKSKAFKGFKKGFKIAFPTAAKLTGQALIASGAPEAGIPLIVAGKVVEKS